MPSAMEEISLQCAIKNSLVIVLFIIVTWLIFKINSRRHESNSGHRKSHEKDSFSGAVPRIRNLLSKSVCHEGHVPLLVSGKIDAYNSITSRVPCGSYTIRKPILATTANLQILEDLVSENCRHRAGWYVVKTQSVCPQKVQQPSFDGM